MASDADAGEHDSLERRGLSNHDAARVLAENGPNEIAHEQGRPAWKLLCLQFNSPVVWLLLAACAVSGALGELADAIAIGAIVVLNAAAGFFQEFRAERTISALRSMTAPRARVIREGRSRLVRAAEVVRGDLLELEAGDIVAADAVLLEANVLSTNEAALTGESVPAQKHLVAPAPTAPLAERHDCVFLGTTIATGTGLARVTATGMGTELGRIAHLLATAQEEVTPLQQRLASLSRLLMYLCIGIVGVVALLGWWRGSSAMAVLLSAVSLAVAVVPEGLPAIVTIALAIGMRRMAARQALLRRLMAVETLGCATVICTDKTGTLTTGVMTVREIWGDDTRRILDVAAACSDAQLDRDGTTGIGDPTELAILAAAITHGIARESIEQQRPRRHVNPFDADRKRMSIYRTDRVLYAKGGVGRGCPEKPASVADRARFDAGTARHSPPPCDAGAIRDWFIDSVRLRAVAGGRSSASDRTGIGEGAEASASEAICRSVLRSIGQANAPVLEQPWSRRTPP
jgi:Ca2+-transporting ATPase